MVGVRSDVWANRFVALQTSLIGIHLWSQLAGACPFRQTHLLRLLGVHLVTGDAGKISATKTRRRLQPIELTSRDANHTVTPKAVGEKIWLCYTYEIFLFAVVGRVWLHDEALAKIIVTRAKVRPLSIEIDFVRHVVEGPDAVALAAIESGNRASQARRIRYASIRFSCQMNFESPDGISIKCDVLISLTVASLTRNPKFRDA